VEHLMTVSPVRLTLRQLPLPAKLVLTVFLCSVGLGYFSALVQLHLKHSSKVGDPMPTPADVVEVFSGLKPHDPNAPPPCAKIDTLITGDPTAADISKDNMTPAFFARSEGWNSARSARGVKVDDLQLQREGERLAMLAWVRWDGAKKTAYEENRYPLPPELKNHAITPDFLTAGKELKIRDLINTRCQACHTREHVVDLSSYSALEPLVTPPSADLIDGKWVRSSRQISVEALTQSTHAHLLSFSVLFTLTGLVFAFTSYPGLIRGVVAPIVLLAQVCDIACWWLARVPTYGPTFATAIIGTGSVVGLGLACQIIFSLLNMYGWKGKFLILLLLLSGGAGLGYVGLKVIQPALDEERRSVTDKSKPAGEKPNSEQPVAKVSHLEKLVMGPIETSDKVPFTGKGSMAGAFFHRDGDDYQSIVKRYPGKKAMLDAEREGERLAIQAWIHADPEARKKAYDEDQFPLPAERAGKPITAKYSDGKTVKVKSILTDRCVQCHSEGGETADFPLDSYPQLLKYIEVQPK
jgi:cytochrome c553